jgi:alpha-tubulin suppressor-like RCC1 family protein
MCGNGERGQLGQGTITKKEYKPLKVEFKDEKGKPYTLTPKFKQVTCGYFHTGFLTESGVIYVTGDNIEGQLGTAVLQSRDMALSPIILDF